MRAAVVVGATFVFLLAQAPSAAAQNAAPAIELKVSTALGPAYAQGKAGEVWAALIRERSSGRLPARHFPGATLVQRDPAREFAALRDGGIDLAVGSTLAWSANVPQLDLLALPWLVPGDAALEALLAGDVGQQLASRLDAAGVVPLALVANGFGALATRVAVRKPGDVEGLKIRVPGSPVTVDLLAALGAQSSAKNVADARAAFASGALDGQEVTVASYAASHMDAVGISHLLLWGAQADALVFAVNRARWDSWTEVDRALVRQAAADAALAAQALARGATDASTLAALARQGVSITRLTPAGKDAFRAASRPVYERWSAVVGEDLVRAAEAAVAEHAATPK